MDNIRIVFGRIFAVLLLMALSLFVFVASPEGLQFAAHLAQKYLPGELYYQKISGELLKKIHITGLYYHHQGTYVRIHQLDFSWSPYYLFRKEIHLIDLTADHIEVIQPPSEQINATQQKTSFENPLLNLNWGFTVENMNLSQFFYGEIENDYILHMVKTQGSIVLDPDQWAVNIATQFQAPVFFSQTLKIEGTPEKFTWQSDTHFSDLGFKAEGKGSKTNLLVELTPDKENQPLNTLRGYLTINWVDQLQWDLSVNARDLDLYSFSSACPEHVFFNLTAHGLNDVWRFDLKNLSSVLYDEKIDGNISAYYENATHFGANAKIESSNSHIRFSIKRTTQWNADWDIAIQHLNHWYRDLRGQVMTAGNFAWNDSGLLTHGSFSGANLVLIDTTAHQLNARWLLDEKNKIASNVTLNANSIDFRGHFFKSITLQIAGWFRHHQIHFSAENQHAIFNLSANGEYIPHQGWKGVLNTFNFLQPQRAAWKIQKPISLVFTKEEVSVAPGCLVSATGRVCTEVSWKNDQPWFAYLDIPYFDLQNFDVLLSNVNSLKGNLNAHLRFEGDKNDLTKAVIQIKAADIALATAGYLRGWTLPRISFSASDALGTVNTLLDAKLSDQGMIHAQATLPHFDFKTFNASTQAIQGQFSISIPDLTSYAILMDNVNDVAGSVKGALQIDGNLLQPKINGQFQLSKAQFALPDFGIFAQNMSAQINAQNSQLTYQIFLIAKNALKITGTGSVALNYFQTNAHITGENILAMNTSQFYILANPDLQFVMDGTRLTLNGAIFIPKAKLRITDFRNVETLPTEDIVYTHADAKETTPWPYYSQLNLTLGDHVALNAYGLRGNVVGNLQVTQIPQKNTIGNGALKLNNGVFSIYGQTLEIQTGELNFSQSPIGNPNVNLLAVRVVGQVGMASSGIDSGNFVVGVKITGTADNPKTELFSAPVQLSQADILSYLLFGHPNPNADQTGAALQALSLLNLNPNGGGSSFANAEKALGINLGVKTNTTVDAMGNTTDEQSSFVVGKYLSPNLYLSYNQGLSDSLSSSAPMSLVQLEYFLSRRWSVQVEAGTGYYGVPMQGADLLYSVNSKH